MRRLVFGLAVLGMFAVVQPQAQADDQGVAQRVVEPIQQGVAGHRQGGDPEQHPGPDRSGSGLPTAPHVAIPLHQRAGDQQEQEGRGGGLPMVRHD